MRDYVICAECGMTIDSDFAISRMYEDTTNVDWFCSKKHADSYRNKIINE